MTRQPTERIEEAPLARAPGGARYTLVRNLIAIAAWGLVVALLVQVYLAGIGVFRNPQNFELHRNVGYLIGVAAIVLFLLLLAVRASRRQIALAGVLVVLLILQSVFVALRTSAPELAALHPVNGFAILLISVLLAQRTWRLGGLSEL